MFGFLVGVARRQAKRATPNGEAPAAAMQMAVEPGSASDQAQLAAAGRAHEVIRVQLADLVQRHESLARGGDVVVSLRASVDALLTDHQGLRVNWERAGAELVMLREQHVRLKQEHAGEVEALTASRRREAALRETCRTLEARNTLLSDEATEVRSTLNAASLDVSRLQTELAEAISRLAEAEDQKSSFQVRFDEGQQAAAVQEVALRKEMQQAAILSEEARILRDALDAAVATAARLEGEVEAMRRELADSLERSKDLEGAAVEAERKHRRMEEDANVATESARASASGAYNKLEAMGARLQVTERLLAQARDDIRARGEELSLAQRQVLQVTLERNAFEKRAEDARRERERADAASRETGDINRRLADRSHELVSNLKAREREAETNSHRIAALNDEIAALKGASRNSEHRFQTHLVELNNQIAHERSSRQMSEGALEAARATIDSMRQDMARLRDGSAAGNTIAASSGNLPASAAPDSEAVGGAMAQAPTGSATSMPRAAVLLTWPASGERSQPGREDSSTGESAQEAIVSHEPLTMEPEGPVSKAMGVATEAPAVKARRRGTGANGRTQELLANQAALEPGAEEQAGSGGRSGARQT